MSGVVTAQMSGQSTAGMPSGSWAQQAQAVPDAQAASASGVSPLSAFPTCPPTAAPPHDLSPPGPEENPQQQPLPASVAPPPGLRLSQDLSSSSSQLQLRNHRLSMQPQTQGEGKLKQAEAVVPGSPQAQGEDRSWRRS